MNELEKMSTRAQLKDMLKCKTKHSLRKQCVELLNLLNNKRIDKKVYARRGALDVGVMREMRSNGATYKDISEKLGCHYQTVYLKLRERK